MRRNESTPHGTLRGRNLSGKNKRNNKQQQPCNGNKYERRMCSMWNLCEEQAVGIVSLPRRSFAAKIVLLNLLQTHSHTIYDAVNSTSSSVVLFLLNNSQTDATHWQKKNHNGSLIQLLRSIYQITGKEFCFGSNTNLRRVSEDRRFLPSVLLFFFALFPLYFFPLFSSNC